MKPISVQNLQRPQTRVLDPVFAVHAEDGHAEITIYDEIGPWGTTAAAFSDALMSVDAERISLKLNSPGGDVFDGIAIYNELLNHDAMVDIQITGLAASAASIIAMAGDSIEMAAGTHMMIHNAWAMAIGNAEDMSKMSETLGQIDGALAGIYAERTGIDSGDIRSMMAEETWLTADLAVEKGFADTVKKTARAKACFDLSAFNRVPVPVKRELESHLRDAGFSHRDAKAAITQGFNVLPRDEGSAQQLTQRDADDAATALADLADFIKNMTRGKQNV